MVWRRALIAEVVVACSMCAMGDNVITEWGPASSGFVIQQETRTVTITAAGTYKFQAFDGASLGYIDHIVTQDGGVTGHVTVYVARSTGGTGAVNLGEINLSTADTSEIAEIRVTGTLGEEENTVADTISGYCIVGGQVYNDVLIETFSSPTFSCTGLNGDFTVSGAGPHSGTLSVNNSSTYTGDVSFAGPLTGRVLIYGDLSSTASISVSGNAAEIDLRGDMANTK